MWVEQSTGNNSKQQLQQEQHDKFHRSDTSTITWKPSSKEKESE